jgi:hypothetical protein
VLDDNKFICKEDYISGKTHQGNVHTHSVAWWENLTSADGSRTLYRSISSIGRKIIKKCICSNTSKSPV